MYSANSYKLPDREEATRESDFTYDEEADDVDEENDWGGEVEWTGDEEVEGSGDGDVNDESSAYLDFLSREARIYLDALSAYQKCH
jgi:importin-7